MADLSIDKVDRCYFDEGNLQIIESKVYININTTIAWFGLRNNGETKKTTRQISST